MLHFIKDELVGIRDFLTRNRTETIIIVSATLFMSLNRYHQIQNDWMSNFIYFGVFPLLVILFILRKSPRDFGLGLGSPRVWGVYVVIACVVAAAVLYLGSFLPALQKYYGKGDFKFASYVLTSCLALSGSEFMYRGFLLFGLKEKFKEGSILLQMIPFALLHLGKPEIETVSTIITGIFFGYVAYRGKSYWPAFIIHIFINVFFVGLINYKYPLPA